MAEALVPSLDRTTFIYFQPIVKDEARLNTTIFQFGQKLEKIWWHHGKPMFILPTSGL